MGASILGYGEILIRPATTSVARSSEGFSDQYIGGAELNAVISLASRGHNCEFLTAIPKQNESQEILELLDTFKIKRGLINFGNHKIGKYFAQNLNSKKNLSIVYDRKDTSFSNFHLTDAVIESALKNKEILIVTGISPALSEICKNNVVRIIEAAKAQKIKIAYDVNYRPLLWTKAQASLFNKHILDKIDFLFANCGVIKDIFGFPLSETNSIEEVISESQRAINYLNTLSNFECVAFNIRNSIGEDNNRFGSLLYSEHRFYTGQLVTTEIVDCIGGGDSFMAAVIHGYLNKWSWNKIADYAAKTFAITHTIVGDYNALSDAEILNSI
jgi:2-dehydro-3-deoxygluconokinase